jgi:transposase-like protein
MSEGQRVTYSKEFKEEAVRLYLEGKGSYRQLCGQFGIKDKKSLRSWVAKVERGESLEEGRGKATHSRPGRPRTKFDSLEEKLAYVEAERDYLKKLYRSRFGHEWGAHKKGTFSE